MNIGAATQEMWLNLCNVLGRQDLKNDPHFIANADRMKNREVLRDLIEAELARKTRREWTELLVEARIPAGPINSVADALQDEQVLQQSLIEAIDHPTLGTLRQVTNPLKISGVGEGWVRYAPPLFGQHTDEVLEEFGYATKQLESWRSRKVIYQAPTCET